MWTKREARGWGWMWDIGHTPLVEPMKSLVQQLVSHQQYRCPTFALLIPPATPQLQSSHNHGCGVQWCTSDCDFQFNTNVESFFAVQSLGVRRLAVGGASQPFAALMPCSPMAQCPCINTATCNEQHSYNPCCCEEYCDRTCFSLKHTDY